MNNLNIEKTTENNDETANALTHVLAVDGSKYYKHSIDVADIATIISRMAEKK